VTTLPAEAQALAPPARACMVSLAGCRFAVEVRFSREVVVLDEYTRVPLAPAHLLGVANLRGNIVPLVDVRPLLGLAPATAGREARALVVEREGMQLALLIDEVLGLEPLDGFSRRADEGDLIAGHVARDGEAMILVDMDALVAALGASEDTMEVR
jgi:purine-binding chemotaxis protein CheW